MNQRMYYYLLFEEIRMYFLTHFDLGVCPSTPLGSLILLHSDFGLCTQPDRSLRIQQAVSRSFKRCSLISRSSTESHRIQGAYLAPKCIKSI